MTKNLSKIIENAFENRAEINLTTKAEVRDAVNETLVDYNDKFMAALKSEITIAIEENLQGNIKV